MSTKLYECTNKECVLGTPGEHAYFTDGMTAFTKNRLTGMPEEQMEKGKDYGPGICPNCGKPGKDTGETHKPITGDDPLAKHHEAVHAEVQTEIAELKTAFSRGDLSVEDYGAALANVSDNAQTKVVEHE